MEIGEMQNRLQLLEAKVLVTSTLVSALLKTHPNPAELRDQWHQERSWMEATVVRVWNEQGTGAEQRSELEHIRNEFSHAGERIDRLLPLA